MTKKQRRTFTPEFKDHKKYSDENNSVTKTGVEDIRRELTLKKT